MYQGDLAADLSDFKKRNSGVYLAEESRGSIFLRNYIYKPALHLRAA